MRTLLIISLLLLSSKSACADVFVVFKNDSKEVISLSDLDDAVVPEGYSKEVLKGDLTDYPLEYGAQDYTFVKKRFVANTKKISQREEASQSSRERNMELESVNKRARLEAYKLMVQQGVEFKHISEEDFK